MENQRGFGNKRRGRRSGRDAKFLRVADKRGRDGDRGKGYKIDEDTYNYFLNVLKVKKKNEFENEEDKEAFIRNSLDQTVEHEVDYSRNQMLSRVLENLLEAADDETLSRFCNAFTLQLRIICADQFASHVLETLLQSVQNNWIMNEKLREWFHSTCKFVLNNFEDFVFDGYANKVMRKLFCCLSGTHISSQQMGNTKLEIKIPACITRDEEKENAELQDCYKKFKADNEEMLKDFCDQFMAWHQFNDLLVDSVTSGLVQALTQAVHFVDPKKANEMIVLSLKTVDPEFSWDEGTSLYLIENAIEMADRSMFEFILYKYFDKKLVEMATHRKANHTLKKLIIACPSKALFETLYDAVQDKLMDIYRANHSNMLVALSEGCKRFCTRQAEYMKAVEALMMEVSGSAPDTSLVELLIADAPQVPEPIDGAEPEIAMGAASTAYNKSRILQCFLHFHKPSKVVKALMALERSRIVKLCTDVKGSRVMDEFFRSVTVGDKNKEKLVTILQDDLVDLSCSKLGSRVMDSIWSWSPMAQKVLIVKNLSTRIPKLNADRFGRFFSEKAAVSLYKANPKEWEEHMRKTLKRQAPPVDLAAVLIPENVAAKEDEPSEAPPKKKKKKKSKE